MHKRKEMPRDGAARSERTEEEPTKADLTQARVRRMDPWRARHARRDMRVRQAYRPAVAGAIGEQ